MERKKTAFSKLFDIVDGIENVVLVIMVIGMVVTIMIQIIGRIIGHPSPWTEETSRYLFLTVRGRISPTGRHPSVPLQG